MFAVLVCLSLLHSISNAALQSDSNKLQFIEDKVELLSSSSEKPQAKEVDDLLKDVSKPRPIDDTVLLIENGKDEDELLTPSESIVFRPLFSYRKTQAKRNKIKNSKKPPSSPNTIRRRVYTYTPPKYVSEYPQHYYSSSYQYYPNPYYHPPAYYPSNRYYYSPYY